MLPLSNQVYIYKNNRLIGYTDSITDANNICHVRSNYSWDFEAPVGILNIIPRIKLFENKLYIYQ